MALKDLSDKEAVLSALAEFDRMGQNAFLSQYGFGRARKYQLKHAGKLYDSKAIAGVAHKFQFGTALAHHDFGGGQRYGAAAKKLKDLGFEIPAMTP